MNVKLKTTFYIFGGITMNEMNIKERKEAATTVIKKTEYVIDGRTGMRMTKEEWLAMREADRDI